MSVAARHGLFPSRSRREWVIRGGLAVLAAALAYVGIAQSLSQNLRRSDPVRAYALAPNDGRAAGQLAQRYLIEEQSGSVPVDITALARKALRADPTVVSAAATLGLAWQKQEKVASARRIMAYAERLTRRDLQTHLWAIEDAVLRNDVPTALRHYDMALRTSREAPELLFPVLAAAITEQEVRRELVSTLRTRPLWAAAFIGHVAGSDTDPQAVSQLFDTLQRNGLSISPDATAAVINRLLMSGATELAWRHYAATQKGVDRRKSRDPRFASTNGMPTLFDWNPAVDVAVAASLGTEQGGGFSFAMSPGYGGVLVHQLQWLPPGTYRFEGQGREIEQSSGSLLYWTLSCREGGGELGRVVVSSGRSVRFAGRFSVPQSCPLQTLILIGRASDGIGGVSGQIDRAALRAIP